MEAQVTRKLLSRSIEPKRACLILSRRLAISVTAFVLRKLARSTAILPDAMSSPPPSRQNSARTAAQEKKLGWTI